ncbi:carboxylesterase/lipase family protein [Paenibacillus hunanensis]|uniref:carboxylesterase/lipase family protein n=1 Tax=Paenibacillus hunanensis TaxID=539262 RepID=UPI002A6AEFDF|nr:carboxylesterase/lipase family protein [Paenibacillus hunanensis]WPP42601.1 carboxylesterase/lipase family protein [Paenibacillus hunanensis]
MENTLIRTQYGEVQGIRQDGAVIWRGIPYAEPPVGDLRFQPPQPPKPWQEPRDATQFGPVCEQPDSELEQAFPAHVRPVKSEDCLYLNIWASDTSTPDRPVMVWIHGGAFVTGAGSLPFYDGTSFAVNGDMVVVTINYRLGPLGFLDLSSYGMPDSANLGLQDQIAALNWVRSNIAAFGGDPERITVFGESAGAMSVASLLAMPAAKGLFRAAIMQSGASQVLAPSTARGVTEAMIRTLGGQSGDASVLMQASAQQLLQAASRLHESSEAGLLTMPFQPVLHAQTLPVEPVRAIQDGAAKGVALMIGTNQDEGRMFINRSEHMMDKGVAGQRLEAMTGQDVALLLERYPETIEGQAQILTDLFFWRAAIQYAEAQLTHAPVWMYRFDWNQPGHEFFGTATHATEIPFVFNNVAMLERSGVKLDEQTVNLANQMQRAWITFAHTATPTTLEIPWTDYNKHDRTTMIFNREIELAHDPDGEKRLALIGE